jgi:hypothetical protein
MTITGHTPTPWDCLIDGSTASIGAQDGGRRIRVATISGSIHNPEIYNDACFIVEAVNNYAALNARVAEMEGALRDISAWAEKYGGKEAGMVDALWDIHARANAALSHAEPVARDGER